MWGQLLTATAGPPINAAHRVAGPYAIPTMAGRMPRRADQQATHRALSGCGRPGGRLLHGAHHRPDRSELELDPARCANVTLFCLRPSRIRTATGLIYDSGDFLPALERALELAEYDSFRQTAACQEPEEPLIGIGVATVVKASVVEGR